MGILGWAKVLETIKTLNDLNQLSYFSLEKFCEEHNLNFHKIINFMEISNEIIDDNSTLVNALKHDKAELNKLKKINVNRNTDVIGAYQLGLKRT